MVASLDESGNRAAGRNRDRIPGVVEYEVGMKFLVSGQLRFEIRSPAMPLVKLSSAGIGCGSTQHTFGGRPMALFGVELGGMGCRRYLGPDLDPVALARRGVRDRTIKTGG